MSLIEKIIFLYFEKKCSPQEIAKILEVKLLEVNGIIMVEKHEIERQKNG